MKLRLRVVGGGGEIDVVINVDYVHKGTSDIHYLFNKVNFVRHSLYYKIQDRAPEFQPRKDSPGSRPKKPSHLWQNMLLKPIQDNWCRIETRGTFFKSNRIIIRCRTRPTVSQDLIKDMLYQALLLSFPISINDRIVCQGRRNILQSQLIPQSPFAYPMRNTRYAFIGPVSLSSIMNRRVVPTVEF